MNSNDQRAHRRDANAEEQPRVREALEHRAPRNQRSALLVFHATGPIDS